MPSDRTCPRRSVVSLQGSATSMAHAGRASRRNCRGGPVGLTRIMNQRTDFRNRSADLHAPNAVLEIRGVLRRPGERAADRQRRGRRLLRVSRIGGGARRSAARQGALRRDGDRELHARRARRPARDRKQVQHVGAGRRRRSANRAGGVAASSSGDQRACTGSPPTARNNSPVTVRSQRRRGAAATGPNDSRFRGARGASDYVGPVYFRKETEPYVSVAAARDSLAAACSRPK